MASNLPAVIAPIVGGWLLARYHNSLQGYQTLFMLAGLTFILGAVSVLLVKPAARPHAASIERSEPMDRALGA